MARVLLLLSSGLLCLLGGHVLGSDVNWGKKVNCFVVDEATVCPGCNYRAGLSCPKSLRKLPSCEEPQTTTEMVSTTTALPTTPFEELNGTTVEVPVPTTGTPLVRNAGPTTMDPTELMRAPTNSPIDLAIFLYRILGNVPSSSKRPRRQTQELGEVCNWSGDCPCPLICCRTGPGCPKRCVMGIRLPPPWG